MPDTSITDQSASGTFTGTGYNISASVYSVDNPGFVEVTWNPDGRRFLMYFGRRGL